MYTAHPTTPRSCFHRSPDELALLQIHSMHGAPVRIKSRRRKAAKK